MTKEQQVDLQGEEVDVAEHWEIDSPRVKELHKLAVSIAQRVAPLNYVEATDIQVVISNKEKRGSAKKKDNIHTFAECMRVRPVFTAIAESQEATLAPFVICFYPPYFKEPEQRREEITLHELWHIKFNENTGKKSLRPHWGFGDTDIQTLHRKYLQK